MTDRKPESVEIDLSQITYLDSAAALSLVQMDKSASSQHIACTLINLNPEMKGNLQRYS